MEQETEYVIDGRRGWEATWKHVGRAARKRVKRAMWRGEALEEPVLAALVVGLVRRTRIQMSRHGFLESGLLDVVGASDDIRTLQLDNAEEANLAVLERHRTEPDA